MTPQKKHLLPMFLLLAAIMIVTIFCQGLRQNSPPSAPQMSSVPSDSPGHTARTGTRASEQAPKLPLPALESAFRAEVAAAADKREVAATQTERDRFFAEERRIMAKTWGLSAEKTAEFEIAVRDGFSDRRELFDRITHGEVPEGEMGAQFEAFHKRARARLVEAIGADHLLEFEMTNGHFVELGLDRKPFVPPHAVPVPVAEQAASQEPQARGGASEPLLGASPGPS